MHHKVLRRREVETRTGLSRSSIYTKLDPKSRYHDPTFPRPISLGIRSIGWIDSAIDQWIAKRSDLSKTEAGS